MPSPTLTTVLPIVALPPAVTGGVVGFGTGYDVEAHDDVEKGAEGTHERFQINQVRFLEGVAEKANRA
jgi:predicted thioesterase